MLRRSPLIVIYLIFAIAPAVAQQALSPASSDTLQAMGRKFGEAFVKRDAASVAAFFTKDAKIVPAAGPAVSGTDILPFWQKVLEAHVDGHTLQITQSQSLGTDLVWATGRWTAESPEASGVTTGVEGEFCQLWAIEGDEWKIRYVEWNQLPEQQVVEWRTRHRPPLRY